MKNILFTIGLLCVVNAQAKPDYILIRQTWSRGFKLTHVEKPKNLKKWYYDSKTDTYYRLMTVWGYGLKMKG